MNIIVKDLVKILHGQLILGNPHTNLLKAVVDSRKIEPGDLFFALKGENVDGHDFAMSACRQKAAGVVVSKLDWLGPDQNFSTSVIRVVDVQVSLKNMGEYLRNSFRGPVVGITGSSGKTTTKQMLASILKVKSPGLSTAGNYNSQIGLPLVLSMLDVQHEWMVLEMGASEPGNISSLSEIGRPQVGVITSIGPAHLKTFGSIQRIAQSKWELMDSLPQDGCAVVPWNEPHLEPHIRAFGKKIVFFGFDSSCPVRASRIELGETIRFTLHIGGQSADVNLPIQGRFNVTNALAAAGAAWFLGLTIDQIKTGLENFEAPKMRMELLRHSSGAIFINDSYNANPSSMIHSIRSLVETYPDREKVAVLGSMLELGDDSEKLHFHLGTEVGRFPLDKVFLWGEETKSIKEGMISVGTNPEKIKTIESLAQIPTLVQPHLNKNSTILFKGSRGMSLDIPVKNLMKEEQQLAQK